MIVVILDSLFTNILIIIVGLGLFIGIGIAIYSFMDKIMGVKIVPRYGGYTAARESEKHFKQMLMLQSQKDIKEASERCKKKLFVLTAENVYKEIEKIKKERSKDGKVNELELKKNNDSIHNMTLNFLNSNREAKIKHLEELRREGLINDEQFEEMKRNTII